MNQMEEFLNFGAVVKIRREYDDDLYKFIKLMKSVGFLNDYVEFFEKNCCYDNEFSEDRFWHYVKLNNGNTHETCIEFQWGKGFTWGDRKEYLDYDSEMKILNVDELIIACNKENLFNMNYERTSFQNELEDKECASELDDFLCFYEWSIVKYPDGKYNIKDEQCNTFDFEENTTFDAILDRVYFRMFDYFVDESGVEDRIRDNEYNFVKKEYENYIRIGMKLKLLEDKNKNFYAKWFAGVVKAQFPMINKYIAERKKDFYNHFSFEQLNEFEETLSLYYETDDIATNEFGELYSKTNKDFNNNIINLSEGMIEYKDFLLDYKEVKNKDKTNELYY